MWGWIPPGGVDPPGGDSKAPSPLPGSRAQTREMQRVGGKKGQMKGSWKGTHALKRKYVVGPPLLRDLRETGQEREVPLANPVSGCAETTEAPEKQQKLKASMRANGTHRGDEAVHLMESS